MGTIEPETDPTVATDRERERDRAGEPASERAAFLFPDSLACLSLRSIALHFHCTGRVAKTLLKHFCPSFYAYCRFVTTQRLEEVVGQDDKYEFRSLAVAF